MLYVGKAQSLRHRVRSYWQKQTPTLGEGHRIRSVVDRIADVEVTEVDSVSEALLLEANLIKRFKPRFNVRLKDDKSYPYIKVTPGRRLPAGRADAQARQRRQPLLRAVRVRHERRRVDEPRPAAVPVPNLHDRHPRRTSGRSSDRACCTTSSAARARASRRSRRPTTAPTSSRSSCSSRAARRRSSRRSGAR